MADIIIEAIFNKSIFTWHQSNMVNADETRTVYIQTLQKADKGEIQPLIDFARD